MIGNFFFYIYYTLIWHDFIFFENDCTFSVNLTTNTDVSNELSIFTQSKKIEFFLKMIALFTLI